jgi:hypothetical protein
VRLVGLGANETDERGKMSFVAEVLAAFVFPFCWDALVTM